jgi:hypothetical protein
MESAQNDTRKGVSYTKSFQRQALYAHFLHGVLKGLRVSTWAFGGLCSFHGQRAKNKGQVEQQMGEIAFVFFSVFCLFYRKSNAYFEDLRDLADKQLFKDCTFVASDGSSASAEVSILPKIRDRVSPQFTDIFRSVEEIPEEVKGAFGKCFDLQLTGSFG